MHVRLQTWMPYTVQVCINGREWLGRQRLRILRGHGVIQKVTGTHRYHVTAKGRQLIAAVLAANADSLSKLKQCA